MDFALRRPIVAEDFVVYRELRSELVKLQSVDTKVEEVMVINKDQNWISTNIGLSRFDEHPDYERYMA